MAGENRILAGHAASGAMASTPIDEDGVVRYFAGFIAPRVARGLFADLFTDLDWRSQVTTDCGRQTALPRQVCWYGDGDAVYPYSGMTHYPLPWTARLSGLRREIEQFSGCRFNGVLCNLYRDGRDCMGWHSDDEDVLGLNPAIVSLSLGVERLIRFRHNRTGRLVEIKLEDGSLLVMSGSLQHHWQHTVPAMPETPAPRINLNFRSLTVGKPPTAD